ncbi:hypothetical protein WH96_06270 [Kiloniella spongiae]|uniref:Uncharacterized protein n=1 Tax=Kiloniella spongiae TaxID=1489064 RepID=A0A0H2MMA6_9PROT|nr:hypothetical protein [Kiloniella spongiae]KLN61877.1 hypothetical protein WH96_06270 [Kiloniella spongiae]
MGFVIFLVGLVGVVFGMWGIYTDAGRARFDEMDGLYPMFSALLGGILVLVSIIVIYYRSR